MSANDGVFLVPVKPYGFTLLVGRSSQHHHTALCGAFDLPVSVQRPSTSFCAATALFSMPGSFSVGQGLCAGSHSSLEVERISRRGRFRLLHTTIHIHMRMHTTVTLRFATSNASGVPRFRRARRARRALRLVAGGRRVQEVQDAAQLRLNSAQLRLNAVHLLLNAVHLRLNAVQSRRKPRLERLSGVGWGWGGGGVGGGRQTRVESKQGLLRTSTSALRANCVWATS